MILTTPSALHCREIRPVLLAWQRHLCFLGLGNSKEHSAQIIAAIDGEEAHVRFLQLAIDDIEKGEGRIPPGYIGPIIVVVDDVLLSQADNAI